MCSGWSAAAVIETVQWKQRHIMAVYIHIYTAQCTRIIIRYIYVYVRAQVYDVGTKGSRETVAGTHGAGVGWLIYDIFYIRNIRVEKAAATSRRRPKKSPSARACVTMATRLCTLLVEFLCVCVCVCDTGFFFLLLFRFLARGERKLIIEPLAKKGERARIYTYNKNVSTRPRRRRRGGVRN